MQQVDQIIHAKWIITCEEQNKELTNHAIAIKDGKIVDILPSAEADKQWQSKSVQRFNSHALMPGFINSHTHLAMNMLRGIADDLDLMDWLNNYIWPAEGKWVSDDFVYDASQLAMAEMIRCGTVRFNDMYFFLADTAKAAEQAGMHAHIGMHIIDVPTAWAKTTEEYFAKSLEFYHQYKNNPMVTPTLAPHSTYTVSRDNLIRINDMAKEFGLKINIHLQEVTSEATKTIDKYNMRPIELLADIGMVSPDLIAIHMTDITSGDVEIIKKYRPNIVHCPESNMKLASGACPVQQLQQMGINVALGTDGAASNNDLDMIGEMRSAAFLGKLTTKDPKATPASDVLKMATLHGAKALGVADTAGSLTPGKSADIIAIDLEQIETQPLYHPQNQIVYAAARNQVTDVWIAGKRVLENRKLLTLDEKELLNKAQSWRKKIKS